jgi:hypothetical protein
LIQRAPLKGTSNWEASPIIIDLPWEGAPIRLKKLLLLVGSARPPGVIATPAATAWRANAARPPIVFYAFDLLRLNGKNLRNYRSKSERRSWKGCWKSRLGASIFGLIYKKKIEELLSRAQELGLEGLIGKRSGSRYEAGKRTGAWVKIKLDQEQGFVIGGYTEPEGSRKHFGALLVGFYEGKSFKFAGRVGTGFSEKLLRSLFDDLQKIRVESCPFNNPPDPGATDGIKAWPRPEWNVAVGSSRPWFAKSNSRNGPGMIGCGTRSSWDYGTINMRPNLFERSQTKPSDNAKSLR